MIADMFDGPLMYTCAAEGDGDLMNGRGDAYCGMLNASYNLGLRGKKYTFLNILAVQQKKLHSRFVNLFPLQQLWLV